MVGGFAKCGLGAVSIQVETIEGESGATNAIWCSVTLTELGLNGSGAQKLGAGLTAVIPM